MSPVRQALPQRHLGARTERFCSLLNGGEEKKGNGGRGGCVFLLLDIARVVLNLRARVYSVMSPLNRRVIFCVTI